jgi:hypothetical protein
MHLIGSCGCPETISNCSTHPARLLMVIRCISPCEKSSLLTGLFCLLVLGRVRLDLWYDVNDFLA